MTEIEILIIAFLGGVIPSLLWLFFWLKQEQTHHDPIGLISLSFIAGMVVVFFVPPMQNFIASLLVNEKDIIIAWAAIEEILKLLAVYVIALRSTEIHEPVDYIIYMTTIALGFAAMENTLFLLDPLQAGNIIQTVITGNLRFIGTTLIHVAASFILGAAMALTFYKNRILKTFNLLLGLLGAIFLHAIFNYLIIKYQGDENIFIIFGSLWVIIIILIAFLQKIKKL